MKNKIVTPIDKKQKKQQAERKQAREQSGRGEHKKRLPPNQNQWRTKTQKKIRNTFNVLQKDDQEPILEEELSPITKMDKEKKMKLQEGEEGNLENI